MDMDKPDLSTPTAESKTDQILRVIQMTEDDGETLDLSEHDVRALKGVLADRDTLLEYARRHRTSNAELLEAMRALIIDANRLCDRQLGGTYEADCLRSLARARAAIENQHGPSEATS